ncbi:uncharacterized protein [Watersipora subatra]|uniref:uncharacterized protein n=1 Tax=Watersipora subatra TaxID=2589382 RepID=UPI00355C2E6B
MDAVGVKVPTAYSQPQSTTEPTFVHRSSFGDDLHHISLVWLICILLAGIALLAALTLAVVLVCRRRKLSKVKGKQAGYPPLPPGMVSEFDLIHGGYKDSFDILFDKKEYKKSSRKCKKSNERYEEKCEQCLDRGHLDCQGHSLSRSSSFGSKDRKNLTFLTPTGYYQHVTDQEGAVVPDPHIYSQLKGVEAMPVVSTSDQLYSHLCDATSGSPAPPQDEEKESVYAVLEDHYEELPGAEAIVDGEPATNESTSDDCHSNINNDELYDNVGSIKRSNL